MTDIRLVFLVRMGCFHIKWVTAYLSKIFQVSEFIWILYFGINVGKKCLQKNTCTE